MSIEDPVMSLRDRAVFALRDRQQATKEYMEMIAVRVAERILHVTSVELTDATENVQEFKTDGLRFKVTVTKGQWKDGNEGHISHDEELHDLDMWNGTGWVAVLDLADVGGVLAKFPNL